jgi:photosystem II stability/assembly factor-like uncharacterized protein
VAVDPASPNRVFLGNGNGLFVSTNYGRSGWTQVLPGVDIWSIVFAPSDPRVVYVTAGAGGLYRSTDGGVQWQPLGQAGTFSQSLTVHPRDPNMVYLGSNGAGLHLSTNGGQTFALMNEGLPYRPQVSTLIRHPLDKNVFYAGVSANGLYKSEDRGQSWTRISSDPTVANGFHLTINPKDPDVLYGGDRMLKKSTDGGRTWTESLKPVPAFFRSFALDPNRPETLFTVDSIAMTMYKSTDGGQTWTTKRTYRPTATVRVCESIVVDPTDSSRVYAASYDFFWKSTNGGETWRRVSRGLEAISTASWIDVITVDAAAPNTLYITTRADRVFKSVDFGETWTMTSFNAASPGKVTVDMADHSTLFLSTIQTWFQSTDGGANWVKRPAEGLPPGDFFQAKFVGLIQDAFDPERFYTGTFFGGILVFE